MGTRARTKHEDRAARRERKRGELLEAAIRVVRREGPAVSMDAIAREAGITKPIVYRAFGDREGLTSAVADRFADELSATLQAAIATATDDRSRVTAAIDSYLAFIEREPAIVRFLINRDLEAVEQSGVTVVGFVQRVGALITQALGERLRERGLDSGAAEPWAFAIVGAVHLAGDWWLDRKTLPRARLVDYLTALIWDGMERFDTPSPACANETKGRTS